MPTDRRLIYAAAFIRSLGIGLLGVLFALNLSIQGLNAAQIGLLVAVGLSGAAAGTFFVSFWADRLGRRNSLLLLSGCAVAGAIGLALFQNFFALTAACFIGMVNAMGRERGALFTLEQTILPETTGTSDRTKALAWYNVLLDAGQAVGSLLGGLPFLLSRWADLSEASAHRASFSLYAGLALLSFFLYMRLSRQVEVHAPVSRQKVSPASRKIITRLSLLFGFDSLAGGFLPGSLVAYWFFKRFGMGEEMLAPLFFFAHIANALSYLAAAWLSKRIGLVRTMVFTHTPANLCLIAIPFVPSAAWAAALYLVRECLVEMDVPTRQSYVLAMVGPGERTVAAGVTNLVRLAAWTVAPTLAGAAMKSLALGLPLVIGGSMKIVYDAMLYFSFRHLKPPEER
ncbi:MAG: MFS transporter [Candidatus Omnitrophota bacterium]|nr:MFS transporter [Candidatus Omnitrophota bacterium]